MRACRRRCWRRWTFVARLSPRPPLPPISGGVPGSPSATPRRIRRPRPSPSRPPWPSSCRSMRLCGARWWPVAGLGSRGLWRRAPVRARTPPRRSCPSGPRVSPPPRTAGPPPRRRQARPVCPRLGGYALPLGRLRGPVRCGVSLRESLAVFLRAPWPVLPRRFARRPPTCRPSRFWAQVRTLCARRQTE